MFLTYGKVFPKGASEQDLLSIYRPRPGFPFTKMGFGDGSKRLVWTSFTANQVDIDVRSTEGAAYLDRIFDSFAAAGIASIRLDAAGYAIKTPGTSCFMTPETYTFLGELAEKAKKRGMEVLVEIHSYYRDQIDIAARVDRVYDFALPPLILHALFTGQAGPLAEWLNVSPRNAITVLDTHDGSASSMSARIPMDDRACFRQRRSTPWLKPCMNARAAPAARRPARPHQTSISIR